MDDLFWLDTGSGRPLVLLHGGFLDHRMWDRQVPAFAAKYRVIAPDARGHGRSANATGPFRPADDVAGLLRHLGTGPVILVGLSMGAATAVDVALEYPELVSGLVVSGAGTSEPYYSDPWTTRTMGAWHAAMASGDLDASVEAFILLAAGPHRGPDGVDPKIVDELRDMNKGTLAKHSSGESSPILPVRDTWERAAGIEVPVLAVNGGLDSPDNIGMAERLVGTVKNGRAVSVDGAAHYPNMERPDEFNEIVGGFLGAL
ncbi:alpha/beta fold hydrolase [Streptomyces monomycini]|uniref:alpha/beta fold hydrolase n=1 Tax=Streptomyces monomycini TaxID=371720 RepID=UPI000998A061|nr:alpha/beta hydrolase [Streptomyces monomycini]